MGTGSLELRFAVKENRARPSASSRSRSITVATDQLGSFD